MPEQTGDARTRRGALAPLIVVGLYLLVALPFIASGHEGGRGAWDSVQYHEPAIRVFADQMPRPVLTDYASATTPGYHLVLAGVARWIDDSTMTLQLAGAAFTIALLWLVAWWCGRRAGWAWGALLCVPFIASNYGLFPGIWLLPDNLAWLGVMSIIVLALARAPTLGALVAMGAILAALVCVRQIHLWAACVVWAHAWINAPGAHGGWFDDLPKRVRCAAAGVAVTIPAFLVLAWFARLWGGLSPPTFQGKVQGVNAATPAFMFMEFAILSLPLVAFLWPTLARLPRRVWILASVVGALALVAAAVPETTWSTSAGRYSGWWNIIRAAPVLGGRTSVVVLALAPLGGVLLTLWLAATPARSRWIVLAALVGFAAAQTASHNVWQRYHEPFLLVVLALMASSIVGAEGVQTRAGLFRPARALGVMAVIALLGALTARALIVGSEVEPEAEPADTASGEPAPTRAA